jgi:hypothetical protein
MKGTNGKVQDLWSIARSIQKHCKRILSMGYSHPPTKAPETGDPVFRITTPQGRRFEVIVREVSVEEEIESALGHGQAA